MATINGWLIDPFAQQVIPASSDGESIPTIKALLTTQYWVVDAFDAIPVAGGSGAEVVCTDTFALVRGDQQQWFRFDGIALAGKAVVVSFYPNGDAVTSQLTQAEVQARVTWGLQI